MVFAVIILNDHKGISFNKKIKDKIKVKMRETRNLRKVRENTHRMFCGGWKVEWK